jgi:ABC-type multidrug transport system ATPase subunit
MDLGFSRSRYGATGVPARARAVAYAGFVEPILTVSSLRVDTAGVPQVDGLSLTSTGEWVLVLGAPRALFEAAAGTRTVQRGELLVEGRTPLRAVRDGVVASAPLDPPLPPSWSPLRYVEWSARLAGHRRVAAADLAAEALTRLKLEGTMRVRLAKATPAVRRATVLAAALATGASTLLIEDPVAGLPPETERSFARIVVRALEGRRAVFFAGRVSLESPVALAADEALVVDGSRVEAQGAPGELAARERAFALRVVGDVRAFVQSLAARGARLLSPLDAANPGRLSVELGEFGTRELLGIAASCDAVVLELRPLARAFA